MKQSRAITVLLALVAVVGSAWGQCSETVSLNTQLYGDQSASFNFNLDDLATVEEIEVSLTWTTSGGASWPADLVLAFDSPDGGCVYFWDYANQAIPGCTGYGPAFPGNWSGGAPGNFNFTASTSNGFGVDQVYPNVLNGTGLWTITLLNTWTPGTWANYNMTITLTGECSGDCFVQNACNYNPDAEFINNDNCIFAEDIYPSGLYDCDGNCYLDFDGDGVCNALEVAGCSEPWACNYNPQATDPPLPTNPCSYPESNEVDCDGNSLLPQFLAQPQNITVSCNSIPEAPGISAQPAPAAVAYYGLLPESCYDVTDDVEFSYTETIFPGDCPGNYTIDRYWVITDCNGLQNAILQTIQVVDNQPPVVLTDLTPDTLDCNDAVYFEPLQAEENCAGDWSITGEPSFVFLPGDCEGESVQKKYTTITDECGNAIEVAQILLIEDNDPPFWLEEPSEQIFTDNIGGEEFDVPVADDVCSNFEVNMSTSYDDGICPLSVVLTRTFVAIDQCGNTSAPFIQTITEETDLEATLTSTLPVTCHGGSDGSAEITFSGGVAPYSVDWNGYNPTALPAGVYSVEVLDANLCSETIDAILITEPAPFTLSLSSTIPECNDPLSGTIVPDVNGGTGNVTLEWNGVNPNAVAAGSYAVLATDESGCEASASVTVAPADIPDPLELNGDWDVVQGDSAAYYYEYTLGSTYEWTYTGSTEQEVLSIFAISLLWDSLGVQEVCVTETNQDGCVGNPVCEEVFVNDDVWNVEETREAPSLSAYPNPVNDMLFVEVPESLLRKPYSVVNALGEQVLQGTFTMPNLALGTQNLPSGQYLMVTGQSKPLAFQVQR